MYLEEEEVSYLFQALGSCVHPQDGIMKRLARVFIPSNYGFSLVGDSYGANVSGINCGVVRSINQRITNTKLSIRSFTVKLSQVFHCSFYALLGILIKYIRILLGPSISRGDCLCRNLLANEDNMNFLFFLSSCSYLMESD